LPSAGISPILALGTDPANANKETAMARMPTIVVPGVPLHVTQLNIGREPMFIHPQDYATFLIDLGEAAAVFGCAVHAYVLMPDHLHLLLTPAEPDGPSRLMHALVERFEEYLDRRYARRGLSCDLVLRANAVHSDRDFLACCRHIELDPVRAGMVSEPVAYRWSSFRANGLGGRDAVLTPHATYLALGETRTDRQRAYRALFDRRLDAEVERLLRQQSRLGVSLRPAEASSG
jgi:putative transposase